MTLIVAIEGIDGAGKTHVCGLLAERLRRRSLRVVVLDKHQLALGADFAGRRMAELRATIWPAEPEPQADPLGTHFYLHLLAAWFAGLARLTAEIADGNDVVLTDGSFYRVIAKAHARSGLGLPWLLSLFDQGLQPDRVVLLDLDPADAWHRRADFKATEIGRWDGQARDAESGFCAYQGVIRAALLAFAEREGWGIVRQAEATSPEQVAMAAERLLDRALPLRHRSRHGKACHYRLGQQFGDDVTLIQR